MTSNFIKYYLTIFINNYYFLLNITYSCFIDGESKNNKLTKVHSNFNLINYKRISNTSTRRVIDYNVYQNRCCKYLLIK